MAWHRAGTANALELSEVVLIYVVAQHNRLLAARHQPVRTYATAVLRDVLLRQAELVRFGEKRRLPRWF